MSKSKRIGTAFESAVANYLTIRDMPCRRIALSGADDKGDLRDDNQQFIIECKGGKAAATASDTQIRDWLQDTEKERKNAQVSHGFLVTKVAGKGDAQAGLWRVHMTGKTLTEAFGGQAPRDIVISVTLEDFVSWWTQRELNNT